MILSFAATSPALLAGAKTCTRREYKPSHAAKFTKGKELDAWTTLPYVPGAHKIARIRLTADATLEPLSAMPDSDYEAEGFRWLLAHGHVPPTDPWKVPDVNPEMVFTHYWFDQVRQLDREMWVVRFELLEVV